MNNIEPKTKRYSTVKNALALIEPLVVLLFLAIVQMSGISMRIARASESVFSNRCAAVALYGLLFGTLYFVFTAYLNFYSGYVIEHKFNLSNMKLGEWIRDEAKKTLLSLIILMAFIELLYLLLVNLPSLWWLYMAMIWIFFTVILVKAAPVLIIPLFFKYESLGDNALKERIMQLAKKCGIRVIDIFRIKLSAKTKKANAALVGIGRTRRVLLGDTLLENYTKDEIGVVLAHEFAHHKLGHMFRLMLFSGISTLFAFYLVKISSGGITRISGLRGIDDIAAFPAILFVLLLFGILITPLQNAYTRALESSADRFALKATGLPNAFISCMKKLGLQNLSDPSPSKLIEIMLYDHPPISKRIGMAKKEDGYDKEDT